MTVRELSERLANVNPDCQVSLLIDNGSGQSMSVEIGKVIVDSASDENCTVFIQERGL